MVWGEGLMSCVAIRLRPRPRGYVIGIGTTTAHHHHHHHLYLVHLGRPRRRQRINIVIKSALGGGEWREYEDAVKRKDLLTALSFLKKKKMNSNSSSSLIIEEEMEMEMESKSKSKREGDWDRDWEVLDTCLNADDMKLVASAYAFLKDQRGCLPNFGKFSCIVLEGPRKVTPTLLQSSTGLPASCFSPKKWGLSGTSAAVLLALLATFSFLLSRGIDMRPNLAVLLGLAFLDSTFLGGTCLALLSSYWPPCRRRILVHEAGHLLTGIFSFFTFISIPFTYGLHLIHPFLYF